MMQRMQRMQPPYKPHCLFYALILCSFLLAHGSIRKPYVFLVDGFSSYIGGHCMEYCTANNIKVIETVSPYLCKYFEKAGNKVPFYLQFPSSVDAQSEWKTNFEDLDPLNSCAFSESDAGIGVAEKIQELFGLKGNQVSPHFRDKFLMSRKLNDHGIATMEQSLVENWSGAATFLDRLWKGKDDGKCVVKPNRGVASDNVFLCNNREEVRKSLEAIIGKPQYGGGLNKNVLLQEFVDGNEYAVDTVAKDGVIKVVALWKYAKLSTNNAPFVYQCSELIDVDGEEAVEVCNFCLKALEKLGMRWGPSHTEIKYSSKGPRLIEVNARWHGQNFVSICKNCIGYDAITLSLDCYYNPSRFEEIPRIPSKTKAYGRIVHLICSKSGTINMVRHLKEIQSLKSFHYLHLPYEAGDKICQTKDIRTDMGYVLLIHESKSVLDEDYDKVLQLQPTMIDVFDLKL